MSRLGVGFRRIEELAKELSTLDVVNQDVCRTQASIRHDTANTVLIAAFSLKECKAAAISPPELYKRLEPASEARNADLWTKKFLRWADKFGRDLFGRSRSEASSATKRDDTLPVQKR